MRPISPRLSLLLLAAAASGCTTMGERSPSAAADNRIDVDSHVLLGEIALEQQQPEEAAEHYLDAALASTAPVHAERAARMAHRLALTDVGHRAVDRWRELDPGDERAHYFAGIFEFRSGRLPAAVDEFSRLLDALDPTTLPSGIALILEALGAEPTALAATAVMAELVEQYPGVPEGHYGLARLALRSGNFDLALENAERAVELQPDWLDARLLLARALLVAGQTDESLALAASLADESDSVEVRLQYSELLLSAGESEAARELLDDILADNPGMPEALRALAFLSLTENDLDSATEHFETLRGNADYRNEAFYYLGRIAEQREDYLQATRSYSRVTDGTHAIEAQIRTSMIIFEQMDDAEGALRHLREFGNANPRFDSEMLLARSRLLLQIGEADRAIALIDEQIAANPDNPEPALADAHVRFYIALAQDAIDREQLDEAEDWLDEGLGRYPGNVSLRYSMALLLQDQGRDRRAVSVLEGLVEDEPDNPAWLNALGYLLTDKFDRHEEARGYIQRALAMDPDSAAIIDSMGWVLFRLGEYEAARDYLERAYRLMNDPEVIAHLVDVHWALGDRDRALELLEQGLSEQPDDSHLLDVSERIRQ
jgi:tetratricopeptide (TPR) repeat protein